MTGRYKAYLEYKDSGIDWVGEVPSSWVVKPTFSVFDPQVTKNTEGQETKVLSLSYGNIVERDVETNFGLLPESFNTYQIVDDGDLILRLTDLQNDKKSLRVGMVKQRGIITSAYLKLRASSSIEPRFAYRLLHSYDTTKVFYGMGGGLRQSMKFEDFRRLPILVPPFDEQCKIANFLDHEIAKIDTLITKQEKLIELLKEKRRAVISHAVTKGLNPDAPMKNSGEEWLGEVPEHWEVKRLKFSAELLASKVADTDARTVIALENIEGGTGRYISTNSSYADDGVAVEAGDVLFGKLRPYLSKVFLCNEPSVAFGDLLAYRPKLGTVSQYLFYSMISNGFIEIVDSSTYGAKMPRASADFINEMRIAVPPITEQETIVNQLKGDLALFDTLTVKANAAIKLMLERKTALISAAVTGKIDVRDWEPK
ncbi:restriction endonuclease subunit S [Photobacterium leiognathi]|uniref:restriction endonuclease subunit S n=1 Tax=Photobacterium leiognathi TaxID=553611 RepID=UPI0027391787|nr:restriction endonuclease subunit S [Photobacterium leiognathi]